MYVYVVLCTCTYVIPFTIREGDTADTGVELTGYETKSPEFTVTTSGPSSTFQGNDYQSAPSDEKNRTPSAFMPEGSYDTLAPADEPTAPSAQIVPPAQNGQSNPNAPKVGYVCMYMHVYLCVYMYACANIFVYICMCVCTHACMCVYIYILRTV